VKILSDKNGNKVAHYAASFDDLESLLILVENGINVYDVKNEKGETPMDLAKIYNS